MAPTGTYIEANGLRVYYEVYGEGEPLLLIHGGTATSQSWVSYVRLSPSTVRFSPPTAAAMAGPTTRRANLATA